MQNRDQLLKRFFYSAVCACICMLLLTIVYLLDATGMFRRWWGSDIHHVFVAWLSVAQCLAGVVLVLAGGAFYRLADRHSLLVLSLVWLLLRVLFLFCLPARYLHWVNFAMDFLLSIVYLLVGRKQLMQQLYD